MLRYKINQKEPNKTGWPNKGLNTAVNRKLVLIDETAVVVDVFSLGQKRLTKPRPTAVSQANMG